MTGYTTFQAIRKASKHDSYLTVISTVLIYVPVPMILHPPIALHKFPVIAVS